MNVQIGGRSKTLDQSDRTAVSLLGLQPALIEQKACGGACTTYITGVTSLGCAASSRRSRMGGESAHWRTGTCGMAMPYAAGSFLL